MSHYPTSAELTDMRFAAAQCVCGFEQGASPRCPLGFPVPYSNGAHGAWSHERARGIGNNNRNTWSDEDRFMAVLARQRANIERRSWFDRWYTDKNLEAFASMREDVAVFVGVTE